VFDHTGEQEEQDAEDEETLGQLEWELASQSGRLTGELRTGLAVWQTHW